ncbi:MAG: nitroreductase family deazaflavin-dependent oxidoreductase [Deltaproteobacteria bacterium]|nr:nitroreductase family deazaflavin-dependent oxidoreductase [Deltaproteobacteria bacterium]
MRAGSTRSRTMTKQWPGYDDYQAGTPRDIPVVLLRPR